MLFLKAGIIEHIKSYFYNFVVIKAVIVSQNVLWGGGGRGEIDANAPGAAKSKTRKTGNGKIKKKYMYIFSFQDILNY